MDEWITQSKLPLGTYIESAVSTLTDQGQEVFDAISTVVGTGIDGVTAALQAIPATLFILIFSVLVYLLRRSLALVFGSALALLLIANLGYWDATMETLSLVVSATLVSVIIGVPLGIASAHRPWLYTALRPILDLMQTIPTFVYLIPTLILFGLGVVPGLISTVIFAIPAPFA